MRANRWGKSLVAAAVLVALAAVVAGCGGANVPCQTDIATVDTARKSAVDAEARLSELENQSRQLEEAIAAEETRGEELAKLKAELTAKLAEKSK